MYVDRADATDELAGHRRCRTDGRRREPGRNGTDHQLRRLFDAGERGQRLGHVVADDLSVHAAETDEQTTLMFQTRGPGPVRD